MPSENPSLAVLNFVVVEELVLVAAGAVRALQAAEEKYSHSNRCENGEGIVIVLKPLNQAKHRRQPKGTSPERRG